MPQRLFLLIVLLLFSGWLANAQTFQTLPEVDAYFKVNSRIRVYVQAKQTREGGDPTQAEFGPSVQFYLKPWIKLSKPTTFDPDEAKKRALAFSVGYRFLPSPDSPPEHRLRLDLTSHFPLKANILISDRNRADLDWQSGAFTWRYRNKLTVERRLTIHGYHPGPYVAAEPFYESQYQKWSTTALYAGCSFPIRKRINIEPYYEQHRPEAKPTTESIRIDPGSVFLRFHF